MPDTLSGIIERVTFHNPDNGFAVLRVQARGQRDLVTVVGRVPSAVAGEFVEATGAWTNDRDHGRQFKADELRTTPPHTIEGIKRFLGSGLIKGIGAHFAEQIVAVFGERTLAVIDESPTFLLEIKGIGPRRVEKIRESWRQQKSVREIMLFLQSNGVGSARAVRIHKTYGDQALDIVRANPYRLATDIRGIGFPTADQIALRIGIDRNSPQRARAAVRYILQELADDGHCAFPEREVIERTAGLTGIENDVITAAIAEDLAARELVRETKMPGVGEGAGPWLYLKALYLAELGVARAVVSLRSGAHPLAGIDAAAALTWVEKKIGLDLAPAQREAIRQAITQKLLIVTGGPGVGKTTIVRGILDIFSAKRKRCALAAPTGRAARRLGETTSREALTLHRLLEFEPASGQFLRDADRPLEADLLVVDETSMVDLSLMNHLLRAVPDRACVVLVGDVDQLPSVGPGAVLSDLIAARVVPVVRLTEIFRQAEQSWIVRAAHQVHQGRVPESAPAGQGDFYFVEASTPDKILDRLIEMVRQRIPAKFHLDPFRDIQVLTPMNRSELGARNLNHKLQDVLNPSKPGPAIERYGWTFRVGDKVIQTANNYQKEVFNGDIGRVRAIGLEEQELIVAYDNRQVYYDFGELDELALAYALTIHKAQGSEYPAVLIPLHTQHFLMLQRNLLYTGITRGKKLVVVVGNRRALELAVQRQDTNRRCTLLGQRLLQNG